MVDCNTATSGSSGVSMPQAEYTHLIRDPVDTLVIWPMFPGSAHFICDWGWFVECTDKYGKQLKTNYGLNTFAVQTTDEKCSRWFTIDVYSMSISTQASNIFFDVDEAVNTFKVGYVNLNSPVEDPNSTYEFKFNLFFDCDGADVFLSTAP